MRTLRRTLTALVFLAPLVILATLSVGMVRRYYRMAEQNLANLLAAEATRELGREVRIGKVVLQGKHAYVEQVQIAESKSLPGRPAFFTARRIRLDFDLRTILLEKDPRVPLFARVTVEDPSIRITRDSTGRWNFADLLKPRPPRVARPAVGRIEIVGGTLEYEDAALRRPRSGQPPPPPVSARFAALKGHLLQSIDRSSRWTLSGQCVSGPLQSAVVQGVYPPDTGRLFLRIEANRASLPFLSSLLPNPLPQQTRILSGLVSGQTTLLFYGKSTGSHAKNIDYQADVRVENASLTTRAVREPIRRVSGQILLTGQTATGELAADFLGSRLRAQVMVTDFAKPSLQAAVTGKGISLQRVLTALDLQKRFPELRDIQARGDLCAEVSGPLNRPTLYASGLIQLQGRLPQGVEVPEGATLRAAVQGTPDRLRAQMSGRLPRLRYREYEAQSVQVNALYADRNIIADFQGTAAKGRVSGRARVTLEDQKTRYRLEARLRGGDLSAIPWRDARPVRGTVSADVAASGSLEDGFPVGAAELQIRGLQYDRYTAHWARVRLRSEADRLLLEPLVVESEMGFVLATGEIDLKRRTLDLGVEADSVALEKLPLENASASSLRGVLSLRNGSITGGWDRPQFSGLIQGFGIGDERTQVDYAQAQVWGTRERLILEEGSLLRLPAGVAFRGVVRRPFSTRPLFALSGEFENLELQDVAQIAAGYLSAEEGSQSALDRLKITGTAQGTLEAAGDLKRPLVTISGLTVDQASVGDYTFDSLTAQLRYNGLEAGGTLHLDDLTARYSGATLMGNASLRLDGAFSAHARARSVPLSVLDPLLADYLLVRGSGELSADISGTIDRGRLSALQGIVVASTASGLTLNGEPLGDLSAVFTLEGTRLLTRSVPGGAPPVVLGTAENGLALQRLEYDWEKQIIALEGEGRGLRFEQIHSVLSRSPYVLNNRESVAAEWLKPLFDPLNGVLDASVKVEGDQNDPRATISWSSPQMQIAKQTVKQFRGTVAFTRGEIELKEDTVLEGGDTQITASGKLIFGKLLRGALELNNMPISLLQQWFPDRELLQGITAGTIEKITIDAQGAPAAPEVTASLLISGIQWQDPQGKRLDGRFLPTYALRVDKATLAEGRAEITEMVVSLNEPREASPTGWVLDGSAGATPETGETAGVAKQPGETERSTAAALPQGSSQQTVEADVQDETGVSTRRRYYARLKGSAGFSWQAPYLPEDAPVSLEASLPRQNLRFLNAVLPRLNAELDASLQGYVQFSGTWRQLVKPQQAAKEQPNHPEITGWIWLQGRRLRYANMKTALTDVDAYLKFDGDTLYVAPSPEGKPFSASVDVLDLKRQTAVARSPLSLSGELALHGQARVQKPLTLEAKQILFAESPLPVFNTGRAAGELSAREPGRPGLKLTMEGTLLSPRISGEMHLRRTDLRLPVPLEQTDRPRRTPAFNPSFHIDFYVEDKVRISNPYLVADVRSPDALLAGQKAEPIRLRGTLAQPSALGSLTIDGGALRLPTRRFAIQPGGRVTIRYNPLTGVPLFSDLLADPQVNVLVDLNATTRLTAVSVNQERRRYTITVQVRGPLTADAPVAISGLEETQGIAGGERGLTLTFKSDPPDLALSSGGLQMRILGLLGGKEAIEKQFASNQVGALLRDQFSDLLSATIFPELLERTQIAQALGLQELAVDYSRLDSFTLRLASELIGPLQMSYWRRLGGTGFTYRLDPTLWEMKLSLRLNRRLQFSWTTDNQSTNGFLLEGVFRY
jgi:hypothetical protein